MPAKWLCGRVTAHEPAHLFPMLSLYSLMLLHLVSLLTDSQHCDTTPSNNTFKVSHVTSMYEVLIVTLRFKLLILKIRSLWYGLLIHKRIIVDVS